MKIQNLIQTYKKSIVVSLLSCAVIAASFLTLKSSSFRNMWSLADSNVEALSISENYVDFRYVGFVDAQYDTTTSRKGNEKILNNCKHGTGSCFKDKWRNLNGNFSIECAYTAVTSSCSELLDKIKEIFAEIQDESGLMTALIALFKK